MLITLEVSCNSSVISDELIYFTVGYNISIVNHTLAFNETNKHFYLNLKNLVDKIMI